MNMNELMQAMQNPHPKEGTIKFFWGHRQNREKSEKENRPIYDMVEMIEISMQGERTVRPVIEDDRTRYKNKYKIFVDESEEVQTGTLLDEWVCVTKAQIEELKFFKIRTVEQLAEAKDNCLPMYKDIANKASDWLASAKSTRAQVTALTEKLRKAEEQIAKHADMVFKLNARIEASEGIRLN